MTVKIVPHSIPTDLLVKQVAAATVSCRPESEELTETELHREDEQQALASASSRSSWLLSEAASMPMLETTDSRGRLQRRPQLEAANHAPKARRPNTNATNCDRVRYAHSRAIHSGTQNLFVGALPVAGRTRGEHDNPVEQKARRKIDRMLEQCGWIVQDHDEMNISAGLGVAIREFTSPPRFADLHCCCDADGARHRGGSEAKLEGFYPYRR